MVYSKKIKAQKATDWHVLYADLKGILGTDPVLALAELISEEYDLPEDFYKKIEDRFILLEKFRQVEVVYRNFYNGVKDIPNNVLREACHECLAKIKEIVK